MIDASTRTALKGLVARNTPILGAALVVAGLGTLVWSLTSNGFGPGRGEPPVEIERGAPLRSAPSPRAPEPAAVPDAATPAAEPARKSSGGFEELKFALLSGFDFPKSGSLQPGGSALKADPAAAGETGASAAPSKIPAEVLAFDQRRVKVTGFMNPIDFDPDGVRSFALTAIPGGCCYGAIPRLNEWVVVKLPEGELVDYAYYDPVTIFGTISIGERYEGGILMSLYRMTPEKVEIGY